MVSIPRRTHRTFYLSMNIRTLQYVLGTIIVVCICTLVGWYLFLRTEQKTITSTNAGRGIVGSEPQSSPLGSVYANLVSTLSSAPTAVVATPTTEKARLWHVTSAPVAGMGFVKKGDLSFLYFIERGTGYLLSADVRARSVERLTNTLMPKTYEALISVNGEVVLRSLTDGGEASTFVGHSNRATSTMGSLTGVTLPTGISSIVWSPDGARLAFVRSSEEGSVISTARPDGTIEKINTTSGIQGWNLLWGDALMAVQKTSQGVPGSLFDLSSGSWRVVEREIPGLSVSISHGARILSAITQNNAQLFILASTSQSVLTPSFATSAEKCAWINAEDVQKKMLRPVRVACAVPARIPAHFPDSWYEGSVHTEDTWHVFDTRDGSNNTLELPPSTPALDVENPIVDDRGVYLAFIDAHDKSLWMLQLIE